MANMDQFTSRVSSYKELYARFAATTQANERNHDSLTEIRGFLAEDNFSAALEIWDQIPDEDKHHIWLAPTKGGWFTTRERSQILYGSNDFEIKRVGNRHSE